MSRITRSDLNYEQHKKDLLTFYTRKIGDKKAKDFVEFYASRYDPHGRSFINHRFAFTLWDDWHAVKKNKMCWYAYVGDGGSGKTTNAKNASYFLDPSFNTLRLKTDLAKIIKMFREHKDAARKSFILDEPDMEASGNSKKGMAARDVFGKARQQQAFLSFCATDLRDIPNYIYKKITRIIYCPEQGKAMLFKDIPGKQIFFLGKLKKKFLEKISYSVFSDYQNYALLFDTSGLTPLDDFQEEQYLTDKRSDWERTLDRAINVFETTGYGAKTVSDRDKIIANMKAQGLTDQEIGNLVGLSRSRITQLIGGFVNVKSK